MGQRGFNESAPDADIRDSSLWANERLKTSDDLLSRKLKRAQDAYNREQEKKELASIGIDIGDIDDE